MKDKTSINTMPLALVPLLWLVSLPAEAIEWQAVPGQQITLFYPGQASWEWLLTDHKGAALIKAGQSCTVCHADMQNEMGQKLVKGELLEPASLPGKLGSIEVEVKTAYDQDKLYLHLEWQTNDTLTDKQSQNFEAMASVMLDDGKVPEINRGGCWGACHDDMNGMASSEPGQDINKYLVKSRTKMTRKGGGDHIRSAAELKSLLDSGLIVEIWQARLNRGQAAEVLNGHILETRHDHTPTQVSVFADFSDGKWTTEFSRQLKVNDPACKAIESGTTYTLGFAVHDGYVQGRRHYVSFGNTLKLDQGPADLIARKQ